ncbi:APC amino acid permease [Leucosporidium creatinivorum]|uniref:APC amino acid permease n=1 Tax=Leucosporidium creatinivorum TaxID=106004 RepID=A0A1Y2F4N2_9BASI|nr:APC amino acid permease [Leucosporidium creatinivorum]
MRSMSEYANKEGSSSNKEGSDVYVSTTAAPQQQFYDPSKESFWTRAGLSWESYKRAPGTTGGLKVSGNADHIDPLKEGSNPMLQQKMKPRHLQMIAVGGSIGTGLFIGTGQALRNGGPLGILIAWSLIGVMLINVTQCLGEMCIMYPVSGGFYTLAIRFLDEGFGVSLGYNYLLQWTVTLPVELTAAGITVQYWTGGVPIAGWITIFWFLIIFVNIFGTLGFAEEEFWSSCLKLFVVVMFIFIGIVMNCGAGPDTGDGSYTSYVGGRYWRDPGPLANGFKGVCAVFVTAAFSFAGTELVGLAATETPDPRKTMPAAVKGTFWRITVIYLSSLLIIGLNLPYNDERLLGGNDGTAGTSPFVIMIDKAGIAGLNHLINVTICISVLSIGLSCVYAGSRVLTALAETGYAPRVFAYVDKSGRPLWSVLFILAWGPIAYVNVTASGSDVFNWLLALSGLSTLFTWGSICLCHIRFRMAWKLQGHSIEELPFRAMGGIYGSIFGCVLVVLVLIAQFYIAVWPIGGTPEDPREAAEAFFLSYLAAPILLGIWIAVFIWKRTLPKALKDIDLDTGRKSWLTVEEMREYRAERALAPWHVKLFRALFTN